MELAGPRRKQARASGGGGRSSACGARDLLSDLPDCLLHTIMSFMKARLVVQTCVLSTRWRHLWRSVPCLNVDLDEFKTKTAVPGSGRVCGSSDDSNQYNKAKNNDLWEEKFEEFTVKVARRCNIALLDSFSLHGDGDWPPLFGNSDSKSRRLSSRPWRLQRLHLTHVPLDNFFAMHVHSVCQSLEDLELDGCTCEIRSITSNSLKSLVLKHCRWNKLSEISSPTLKTLVIHGGLNESYDPLVTFAPAVAYLHLVVNVDVFAAGAISIQEMPSLDKASIQFCYHGYFVSYTELNGDRFKFLHSVSNVTSLELSCAGTTVLGKEPTSKEFQNLKNLLLSHCDLSDDCILEFFLRRSPNLERLTLRHCKLTDDTDVKPVLKLKTTDLLRSFQKKKKRPICCVKTSRLKSYIKSTTASSRL